MKTIRKIDECHNGCCYRQNCNKDLEKCCYLINKRCLIQEYRKEE